MITKFSVSNYKGFQEKIEFDLTTTHDYKFHPEAVENSICKKVLIFGKNGTGKSNLGDAIMDIVIHLTDKNRNFIGTFKNLDSKPNDPAVFEYQLSIDGHNVRYLYKKLAFTVLTFEELYFDGEEILYCDFEKHVKRCNLPETSGTDLGQFNFGMSFCKFLHTRIDYNLDNLFNKFYKFVDNMLSFKCLKNNRYDGFRQGGEFFADIIEKNGGESCLRKLEQFIYERTNVKYRLKIDFDQFRNHKEIFAKFDYGSVPLGLIWSTGTSSLVLFFCWMLQLDSVSFLYLDEFDAFYHYELSEDILKIVNEKPNFQSIVTTHNCGLMSNKLTRPDCCYLLSNNHVKKLVDCTEREIREGHNLENLYKNGAFCE